MLQNTSFIYIFKEHNSILCYNLFGDIMKKFLKSTILCVSAIALIFTLLSISLTPSLSADSQSLVSETYRSSDHFDTQINITFFFEEGDDYERIKDGIDDLLAEVHKQSTRYEDYTGVVNLKTINNNPGEWHEVDDLLFTMINEAVEYYDETNGRFDISLGPVIDLWDSYREQCLEDDVCTTPSDSEIDEAAQHTGIERIDLDHDDKRVRIEEGMSLDLGGFGKGYGAKRAGDYLRNDDTVEKFLINAGTSNIEVGGTHPQRENGLWYVGLTNPNPSGIDDQSFASAKLEDGQNITTSGDYQRYYMADGQRIHHLIDPDTNRPTDHHRAVSLISEDGAFGDLLVTAIYVMGIEEGMDYVNARDDISAIWFTEGGTGSDNWLPAEGQGTYAQNDDVTLVMSDDFQEQYLRQVNIDITTTGPTDDDSLNNDGDDSTPTNGNDGSSGVPGDPQSPFTDTTTLLLSLGIPVLTVIIGFGGYALYINKKN